MATPKKPGKKKSSEKTAKRVALPRTHFGNPILRKRSKNIPKAWIGTDLLNNLIATMFHTMRAAKGVGLAAPQIGEPLQLAVIGFEGEHVVLINPTILGYGKEQDEMWEGCLSLPGVRGVVPRPSSIVVRYTDAQGITIKREIEGYMARIFQHEIDHLNGTVYVDRITDIKTLIAEDEYMERIVGVGE
jgi:peptide deformylase